MASLQRFTSHGRTYWRLVESYRRPDGRPAIRTLAHLGRPDDLLARLQTADAVRVHSVACGAVDAVWHLAQEFDLPALIDAALAETGGRPRERDGLTVGASLTAAAIARLCHPSSKRAVADWAATTTLPRWLGVPATALTSQHFWDQMDAVPVQAVPLIEERIVQRVVATERVAPQVLAYDTTNFFTHLATTNARSTLAQRGHNKQRRHDLRQLGLALVVTDDGQLPLGHVLYEGARPDGATFAAVLAPLRTRLHRLLAQTAQLTLVFDQGAETTANLAAVREGGDHYVTALKPSAHRAWLATVVDQLAPVTLGSGEVIPAYQTRRRVHGVDQTVVVVRSATLADGQRRGLDQHLAQTQRRLAARSVHPRGGRAALEQRVRTLVNRQYVRDVLRWEVRPQGDGWRVETTIDLDARQRLQTQYFGLRVLATSRDEWTTAHIIEASRGQARVERAFRDLKDPWVGAFRPQYHWTDQKLVVHALLAVLALLLGRILLRRAQAAGFQGSLRTLLHRLATVRRSTRVAVRHRAGRPRVTEQLEEGDADILRLATALQVRDGSPTAVAYTRRRR
jgi:transposase